MVHFTINVKPVTKKNSQRIIRSKEGRMFLIPSKAYKKYEMECCKFIPKEYIDYRCNVKAVFYMATRTKVDLVNLQEALLDVLVKYHCIADDNSKIVYSMDGSYVGWSKDNPRTEVWIERMDNDH